MKGIEKLSRGGGVARDVALKNFKGRRFLPPEGQRGGSFGKDPGRKRARMRNFGQKGKKEFPDSAQLNWYGGERPGKGGIWTAPVRKQIPRKGQKKEPLSGLIGKKKI